MEDNKEEEIYDILVENNVPEHIPLIEYLRPKNLCVRYNKTNNKITVIIKLESGNIPYFSIPLGKIINDSEEKVGKDSFVKDIAIQKLQSSIKDLQDKLTECGIKMEELKSTKEKLEEKNQKMESEFKEFLIQDYLHGDEDLTSEPLSNIKHLVNLRKKDNEIKEKEPQKTQEMEEMDLEDYTKGSFCVCKQLKSKGAKGCSNCSKEMDRVRKQQDISREEAWEIVWESHGKKAKNK